MKKKTENNPIVIGALLAVMLGALVVIFRSFVPSNDPLLVATPVPTAPAAFAAAPVLPDSGAQAIRRDPFFHSDIQRIAAADTTLAAPPRPDAAGNGDYRDGTGFGDGILPDSSAFTTPTAGGAKSAVLKTSQKTANKKSVKPAAPPLPDPATAENATVQQLRLTAILGGNPPRAILDGITPNPVVLCVGDKLGPLQVVAIHAQEIVLCGTSGLWTIPLQSEDAPLLPPKTDHPTQPIIDNHRE